MSPFVAPALLVFGIFGCLGWLLWFEERRNRKPDNIVPFRQPSNVTVLKRVSRG